MIQLIRVVCYGIVCAILLLFVVSSQGEADVHAAERVQILKTYELTEDVGYIRLTLEGYDGAFNSTLTLPDGHRISNDKSTRIQESDGEYWVNEYMLSTTSKGVYTFTIDAPKRAYYNLTVHIPLFSDIAQHWAEDEITAFVQQGIVNGYGDGRFGPDDPVTGEALVKMLVLALTEEQPSGKRQWVNVFRWKVLDEEKAFELGFQEFDFATAGGTHWATPYLDAASKLGITGDWKTSDFSKSFKRQDVAVMIANVLELVTAKKPEPKKYTDTTTLKKDVQDAISLVSSNAIFTGYPDGSFKPEKPVTRAEAVKVLNGLIEYMK